MPIYSAADLASQSRDRILRGTGDKSPIRLVLLDATEAAQAIADQHKALGYSRGLLGETCAAALLLASRLKGQGALQLRLKLTGDIGLCAADATPMGLVRARIPAEDIQRTGAFEPMVLPRLIEVNKLDGEGNLLSKSMVEMTAIDVSASLSHYLSQSEQVEATIRVGSKISEDGGKVIWCGGFLAETFPDADQETRQALSRFAAQAADLNPFAKPDNRSGLDLEKLFETLRGDIPAGIHQTLEVTPFCPCSRAGVLKALASLAQSELESMVEEGREVELHCEFCRRRYTADIPDIEGILENLRFSEEEDPPLP